MRSRRQSRIVFLLVVLVCVGVALASCAHEAEGDKGYENRSDLANAEATAEAFVSSVQEAPFVSGGGAMKFYISHSERGFIAELLTREGSASEQKEEFGLRDIVYDSRIQKVVNAGSEVRFLYEELTFSLQASKEKSRYAGDPAAQSRVYRVVVDSTGRIGLASMLRLVKDGAAVAVQLSQQQ